MEENNEKLILNPEFIPFYPSMFRAGFLAVDCVLYWFIRFFLANNDRFYCTDKQIGDMLGLSVKTVSRSFKKLKETWFIKTEYRNTKWGWKSRIVELGESNGHGWPFMNGHGWPYIKNNNLLFTNVNNKYMSDFWKDTLQTSSKNKKLTPEQEEKFERVRKIYPQKSGKQEAKGYFVNCDYDELLFDANMKKRKVILGITEKRFILGGQRRMRDFTPQEESMKHVEMREIFEKHMQMGWDKRERMLQLETDFPSVDFNQLYKEWSDKNSILNKISFK